MLKEGVIIGERYEIISRVGSGGMADVYKSMDHKLNRMVAVKILKAEFRQDTGFIGKFTKEAQAAAGLSHPNIVSVYDVGEDRGLYYIVMELVEGITLKNYIMKKGKLSVKEATSIAVQVSLGLEAAHNQGIIHRDVKPQNIIISTDGKVKLSDFGIAKATNSNTITANVMGSVHYSSPEQVRGGFSDAKSDIYSLGITMYEMVTGRVPFDGDTTVSIAIKHLQEEIIPPSRYTPDLPYSLEQIILKCTQKNPDRRYSDMGELIEDLKRSLMDPQGNFVVIPSAAAAGAAAASADKKAKSTAGRTADSAAAVKGAKTRRSSESKSSKYSYDDDPDEDISASKYKKYSNNRNSKDDDDDEAIGGSKLEKAITIGGFVIGAVIIVILVIVIGNMAGLFRNNSSNSASSGTSSAEVTLIPAETQDNRVEVPDFMGMTLEKAQTLAAQYGLEVRQTGTQSSEDYAEGLIVYQETLAHTKAEAGTVVNVVLSSGSTKISIPGSLVGATQTDVENVLSSLGLVVNAELIDSDLEAGRVAQIDPVEGSAVDPGSTVNIYVSNGTGSQSAQTPEETQAPEQQEQTQPAETEPEPAATPTPEPTPEPTVNGNNSDVNSGSGMVANVGIYEPVAYMGGTVTIRLLQNGVYTDIYSGANPWPPEYAPFNVTVYGAPGLTTGTIQIFDYAGDLIDSFDIEFTAAG